MNADGRVDELIFVGQLNPAVERTWTRTATDRDNSLDSRAWGFVPRELVIGRAMFVYWSYDETKPFDSPFAFFTNTRWSRTGTMVK